MEFRVLGPVVAAAGEQTAALGRGRRRTILAVLLAARGETVATDTLVDALWGDAPPTSARKSLQSHVSRLRTRLADLHSPGTRLPLVSADGGYRLDVDGHEVDAVRFEGLAARARELFEPDPQRAAALLDDALALWRGRAFGDLADHPAIRAEAARLEQMRRAAAADLVDVRLAMGQHDEVIATLEQAVVQDPLGERAHGQLMVALYRSGRQGEALRVHRDLQERLREELGVDPSPAIQQLQEQVLRQDPRLATPTTGRASTVAPTGSGLVPPDLIGRDEDVAAVADRLEPGRVLTLTGPGGVGKTRLAEQAAARAAPGFGGVVVVAELAAVREADSVGDALVTALGVQPTGERSAAETLVSALGDRQVLMLLDNCEHVLGTTATLVESILGRCPNVAILATSRERLHLTGEHLWQVAPLAVPARDAGPAEIARTPAGALFCLRAEAAEPTFELDAGNAAAVAELCRRLDGMPLAIELAAARLRAMTPQDLVDRLDQRFSLLAGGPRHEEGRHRTLQAVVAWSYGLLDAREAQLFDRLSVFAGAFSLEAAERVCAGSGIGEADVAGLLGELVDKSMVVVDRRDGMLRYRLLDTLREFGGRRLAEVDDPRAWRRAHATHHVELAERLGPKVRGPEEGTAVAALDASFDDLRSAHAWLVEAADVDGALRLPGALGDYAFYRLRDEVTTWARRGVALPGAGAQPAYAAALTTAAYGATSRDECERAHREATTALAHAGPGTMARTWAVAALGVTALYEGRLQELLTTADDLEALARRRSVPFYVAFAGVLRVIGHTYRGEHDEAFEALRGLDAAAEASGAPTMRAFARYCRGEAHLESRPSEAGAALEEAIDLAREVDNALIEGVSLVSLASLRGRLGESAHALRLFREIVAHWQRLGDHTHQLTTLRNLVALLATLEADEPAAVLHGAVTAGVTPSFGLEAQRLDAAWEQLEARLGAEAAAVAAARGRRLGPTQLATVALRYLDALAQDDVR